MLVTSLFNATSTTIWSGAAVWAQSTWDNLYPLLLWVVGVTAAATFLIFLTDTVIDAFYNFEERVTSYLDKINHTKKGLSDRYDKNVGLSHNIAPINLSSDATILRSDGTIGRKAGSGLSGAHPVVNLRRGAARKIKIRVGS